MVKPVAKWWLYTLMAIVLISGTCNTVVAKVQDGLKSDGKDYNHPYFQTASMFTGELMCLFLYLGDKYLNRSTDDNLPRVSFRRAPSTGLKARLGPFVFALPAALDLVASAFMMVGLGLTAASVYQMMRGFIVVVVALYSRIILKKNVYRHQFFGVVLVFFGVVIVGLGSVFFSTDSESRNPALGAILILLAQFLSGAVVILEEKFFSDVVVPPLQAVGIEGLSGVVYFSILLPLLYFIPCSDTSMCSGDGHVEDFLYAFKQLGSDGLLMFTFWAYIFSISFFNWAGLSITKNESSLARVVTETARTAMVWMVNLAAGWEAFSWVQLVGFVVLVAGAFLYNEVVVIPWWGFKEAVERYQEEMNNKKVLTNEDHFTDDPYMDDDMDTKLEDDKHQ